MFVAWPARSRLEGDVTLTEFAAFHLVPLRKAIE